MTEVVDPFLLEKLMATPEDGGNASRCLLLRRERDASIFCGGLPAVRFQEKHPAEMITDLRTAMMLVTPLPEFLHLLVQLLRAPANELLHDVVGIGLV